MDRKHRGKPNWQTEIASERIEILFTLAEKEFPGKYADRYVELARKIGMRYNVTVPRELKRKICKNCGAFLKFGVNSTHRTDRKEKAVIILCKRCGERTRYPYRREKASKRLQRV